MFKKVNAVILLVSNMKRSIKFYRDTLGMELKKESKDWTEFSLKGTVIALHPAKTKIKMSKGMLVGFTFSDLESTCKELRKKRVKFYKKLTDEPFGKHAIILDPDGHLLSLAEITPKDELTQAMFYYGFAPK